MNDKEPLTTTPHFDEASLRQARPAVPLSEVRPRRNWLIMLAAAALVAGIIGGVIGGIVAGRMGGEKNTPAVSQTDVAPSVEEQAENAAEPVEPAEPAATVEEVRGATAEEQPAAYTAPAAGEAGLREALAGWIEATNSRDIERQMSFYDQKVQSFYLARNVTIADVRSERERVFEHARSIRVGAGEPRITISPDGHSAVMRFRKRYSIEGGGENRRGEVVQELRWQLVGGRWKITSERDLLVVR